VGPIKVYGTVTVGHRTETYSTGTTEVTEYRDATRVCPAPVLSSVGAAPSGVDIGTAFLKRMFNTGDTGPPTPPGLRMHGSYGGHGGIEVEFYPESAVVSCGDAAHASPCVVRVSGVHPVIKIEDTTQPILLDMRPNGDLDSGSGPYEVHGRTITCQDDNGDFTFAPLNMTCNLGNLSPGASPAAPSAISTAARATGSITATPGAPTGSAVLTIISGFPAQPGVLNPLAVHPYVLLRDDFDAALRKGGIQIPPGVTGFQVMGNACGRRTPDCPKAWAAINAEAASVIRSDVTGRAAFPGVPPGEVLPDDFSPVQQPFALLGFPGGT
jgi:hypothetical protein